MKENTIGKIILEARRNKNLSQDALANKLYVSRQTISNWENNVSKPDLETLERLCKVLDLDFLELKSLITGYKEKKKKRKLNKFLIAFLVILLLIMVFIILLVRYKNKFEVYNLTINTSDISITNGIFIKSNVNYYLQLGSINLLDDDINNYKVRLYCKDKFGIRLLIETNYIDNIILNEHYGYGEYFDASFDINNVYMDLISLTDSKKVLTYKLEFNLLFKSEKLFYFEDNNIVQENKLNKNINNINITEDMLIKNSYKLENNIYIKEIDNGTFQYDLNSDTLYYSDENNLNLEYRLKFNDIYGKIYNFDKDDFILNFNFDNNTKKLTCYSESCDGYGNYVNFLKNEVNNLVEK